MFCVDIVFIVKYCDFLFNIFPLLVRYSTLENNFLYINVYKLEQFLISHPQLNFIGYYLRNILNAKLLHNHHFKVRLLPSKKIVLFTSLKAL